MPSPTRTQKRRQAVSPAHPASRGRVGRNVSRLHEPARLRLRPQPPLRASIAKRPPTVTHRVLSAYAQGWDAVNLVIQHGACRAAGGVPCSRLALPAPLGCLLPIGHRVAGGLQAPSTASRAASTCSLVMAVEQEHGALVGAEARAARRRRPGSGSRRRCGCPGRSSARPAGRRGALRDRCACARKESSR